METDCTVRKHVIFRLTALALTGEINIRVYQCLSVVLK